MVNVQFDIPEALVPFTVTDNEHSQMVRNAMILFLLFKMKLFLMVELLKSSACIRLI